MRRIAFALVAVAALAGAVASVAPGSGQADEEAAPIFGVKIPPGYRDWRLISVAHEEGNLNDLRAILGNDVAIKASREGKLPFPDGTIIARPSAAGGSLNSTTVNPPTRRCTTPAFPATRSSKLATLSSTVTHRDAESHGMPPAYDHRREAWRR